MSEQERMRGRGREGDRKKNNEIKKTREERRCADIPPCVCVCVCVCVPVYVCVFSLSIQ